jgi:hypothetical protein
MKIEVFKHKGPRFTVKKMYEAAKHKEDIGDLKNLSFEDYFNQIKNIPYRDDPDILYNSEIISRPLFCLNAGKLDCKKKAILMGAFCNSQRPPLKFKYVVSSERPDKKLHHVFPIVKLGKSWLVADPTYKYYYLGQGKKKLTKAEIL